MAKRTSGSPVGKGEQETESSRLARVDWLVGSTAHDPKVWSSVG